MGVSFGTLSKSFGGVGGFVCSNGNLIKYLKGYSSPWNFSCASSPAVIGGLIKEEKIKTINKVPILGDIPLLGMAFRNTSDLIRKTEIVIFLTPQIISGDAEINEKLTAL